MRTRACSSTRELLRLYSLAAPGEHNLASFVAEHPDLLRELGASIDGAGDDAAVALALAPWIGKYKRSSLRVDECARTERAEAAARRIAACARHRSECIEVDADTLLADVLADATKKYVAFQSPHGRIAIPRAVLLRARVPLRVFLDVAAFVDGEGLHFRWRGGFGGLNLRPHVEERGAASLEVNLETVAQRKPPAAPVLLAQVLAELGFT